MMVSETYTKHVPSKLHTHPWQYIAVLPLSLTVRSTNVYEDQSLGIYPDGNHDENDAAGGTVFTYIGWQQVHGPLRRAFLC